ncbi:MAG: hypothetical protein ACR2NA_12185 [Solirubrobacterales bacterium]
MPEMPIEKTEGTVDQAAKNAEEFREKTKDTAAEFSERSGVDGEPGDDQDLASVSFEQWNTQELRVEAHDRDIDGAADMNRSDLIEALREQS